MSHYIYIHMYIYYIKKVCMQVCLYVCMYIRPHYALFCIVLCMGLGIDESRESAGFKGTEEGAESFESLAPLTS